MDRAIRQIQAARKNIRGVGRSGQDTSRDLKGMNRQLDRTQHGMRGVSNAARNVRRLLIGLGAFQLFRTSLQNTIRQEQALAQVEARIKSTGGAAGFTTEQLADMASELQKVTNFGDEAILEAQSLLLTFTPVKGEVFERTTKAVLNLATATGQDLRSSVQQLGKVLSDPVSRLGELSRIGIILTESQEELVKQFVETGDLARAQAVILDELQVEFGGAAVAARDTFGGAVESLGNAWGDLLEGKGGLNNSKEDIEELTSILQDPQTVEGINNIISGIATSLGVLAKAGAGIANAAADLGRISAINFGGLDELTELEARIEQLQDLLGADVLTRTRLFSGRGVFHVFTDNEIKAELQRLKQQKQQLLEAAGFALGQPDDALTQGQDQRLTQEQEFSARLKQIKTEEAEAIRQSLNEQVRAYDEANSAIEEAQRQREQIEQEFSAFVDRIRSAGEDAEPPSFIDAAALARQAQALADTGDFERAIELAREAAAATDELAEAEGPSAALTGLAKQIERAANAAAAAREAAAQAEADAIEQTIGELLGKAQALENLTVGFDQELAQADAEALRQAVQRILEDNPVVIPVQLGAPESEGEIDPRVDQMLENLPQRAEGGLLTGPGTETSDSILLRGSRNEYMLQAKAVRHYGLPWIEAINRMKLPKFATGGLIGNALTPAPSVIERLPIPQIESPVAANGPVGTPVNIHLDGREYPLTASPDTAADIQRVFGREALKRGRRRQ